jgi:hypothetical protein
VSGAGAAPAQSVIDIGIGLHMSIRKSYFSRGAGQLWTKVYGTVTFEGIPTPLERVKNGIRRALCRAIRPMRQK